jgi:hypothetical protein
MFMWVPDPLRLVRAPTRSSRVGFGPSTLHLGSRPTCWVHVLLVLMLTLSACAKPPAGPPFEIAEQPPANRARIYLFRSDVRSSRSTVNVTIDGREIGAFQDREYETLEVAAGLHHLRAGLRSVAFVAWGWNDQRIRLDPGKTIYIQLSARLTERAQPGGRELEIAGRPSGAASENVYLQIQPKRVALPLLRGSTRRVP